MVWIPDSRHFQPVLGRKFHVESEFEVEIIKFLKPEGKNKEKRNSKNLLFNLLLVFFVFFKICSWGYIAVYSATLYYYIVLCAGAGAGPSQGIAMSDMRTHPKLSQRHPTAFV